MMHPDLRAVVFDLDGTLADTASDIHQALVRSLATEGLSAVELADTRLMIGGGPRVLVMRALDQLGVADDEDLVTALTNSFLAEYLLQQNSLSQLFDGVVEGLAGMKRAGLRLGLCSNKPDNLCHLLVDSLGIGGFFDVVLGFGAGLPRKPDPAPLLYVIEKLEATPKTTLYVGDSETDVKTARAAGVSVVLVSYGYTLRHASQLSADGVVDSIFELAAPGLFAHLA